MGDDTVAGSQYRRAAQAAGFFRVTLAGHGGAAQGGVGGDHAVHAMAPERGSNHIDLCVVQVGCDLDEQRHAFAMLCCQGFAALGDLVQQRVQRFVALQRAQVFGVGTGDIDGHVVGMGVHAVQAGQVVVHRVVNRRSSVFADVQAQHQR